MKIYSTRTVHFVKWVRMIKILAVVLELDQISIVHLALGSIKINLVLICIRLMLPNIFYTYFQKKFVLHKIIGVLGI